MFDKFLKTVHDAAEVVVGRQSLDAVKMLGIRHLIQEKLNGHGELVDLQFDSQNKRLALELKLKGEDTTLHLEIEEYRVEEANGEVRIVIQRVSASKAWINGLLPSFLPLAVPVPGQYAEAVKILL